MLMLDRRMLLRASSAGVGAAALVPVATALARAPEAAKRAQPSFDRFKLGSSSSPSSATARSRSRPNRCGAIAPRTQEGCSHPRSSRLAHRGEGPPSLADLAPPLILEHAGHQA